MYTFLKLKEILPSILTISYTFPLTQIERNKLFLV